MTTADSAWRDGLAAALERAPAALRALASHELHVGGFTNVRLEHPVLDLRGVADEARAADAIVFLTAGALLHGATLARVHLRREHAASLPARARRALRGVLLRVDDENVGLLRYFDLYLAPLAEIGDQAGARLRRAVERAVAAASRDDA